MYEICRMIRGHVWSMLSDWIHEFPEVRANLNNATGDVKDLMNRIEVTLMHITALEKEVTRIVKEEGRTTPRPKLSKEEQTALEKEEAKKRAIEEADREESALSSLKEEEEEFAIDFDTLGSM